MRIELDPISGHASALHVTCLSPPGVRRAARGQPPLRPRLRSGGAHLSQRFRPVHICACTRICMCMCMCKASSSPRACASCYLVITLRRALLGALQTHPDAVMGARLLRFTYDDTAPKVGRRC